MTFAELMAAFERNPYAAFCAVLIVANVAQYLAGMRSHRRELALATQLITIAESLKAVVDDNNQVIAENNHVVAETVRVLDTQLIVRRALDKGDAAGPSPVQNVLAATGTDGGKHGQR